MNFEPQKFFIGLVDFFSVLLPGALFTFLFKDGLGNAFLGPDFGGLTGTEAQIAFLFASYLFGHFIFLIGAGILDDWIYDPLRDGTDACQVKRLSKDRPLAGALWRSMARWMIGSSADKSVAQAVRIKERFMEGQVDKNSVNAFQWCKARLQLEHAAALESVHRFEADSKFFRSLIVVLVPAVVWFNTQHRWWAALGSIALLLLAFWRYVDQRLKATSQAYWHIIALETKGPGAAVAAETPDALTHAGGVVYRRAKDGTKQYLLVQAKKKPNELVLPKGHIEFGEKPRETAIREVHEESGVWARIVEVKNPLLEFTEPRDQKPVCCQCYLMEFVAEDKPRRLRSWIIRQLSNLGIHDGSDGVEHRQPKWLKLEDAIAAFPEKDRPETHRLLKALESKPAKSSHPIK